MQHFYHIKNLAECIFSAFEAWDYIQPVHCDVRTTEIDTVLGNLEKVHRCLSTSEFQVGSEQVKSFSFLDILIAVCKLKEDLGKLRSLISDFRILCTTTDPSKRYLSKKISNLAKAIDKYSMQVIAQQLGERHISDFSNRGSILN